jgi:hypothetical protein
MKKFIAAALAVALLAGSSAYACTADELTAKATAFATKLQDLAKKDPQKASAWSQQYAAKSASPPTNVDEACKFYDDLAASLPN